MRFSLRPVRGTVVSPPERLRRASLLQVIFSVRSERLVMEQVQ